MNRIKIITPDPIVEALLTLLVGQLPETKENTVLLDAACMKRLPEFPEKKIILFTASADPDYLTAARERGADGFWYLQPSAEALAQVLREGASFPEAPPVVPFGDTCSKDLTKRELEVLRELAAGKTDAEIGSILNMSVPTVKYHIQQLRTKTGLFNRTQIAVTAVSSGVIDLKK